MLPKPAGLSEIKPRLRRRLQQRYLRWLARQPVSGFCRWPRRRTFCRAARRRIRPLLNSKVIHVLQIALFVCAVFIAVGVVIGLPVLIGAAFLVAPENHRFADEQERSLVALTRLTGVQTFAFPLIVLGATCQAHVRRKMDCRELRRPSDLVRGKQWRISSIFLALVTAISSCSAVVRLPHGRIAAAIALTMSIALGLAAVAIGKRFLAIRLPRGPGDLILGISACFLALPNVILWAHPVVSMIAEHLEYLGPFGWLNRKLIDVGHGDFRQVVPLALVTAAMSIAAWLAYRTTLSGSFWRKVLNLYRAEHFSIHEASQNSRSGQHGLADVRSVISGGFTFRRFIAFACDPLHLFVVIAGLAVQGLFLGLAQWVTHVAVANDLPTPHEATSLYLAAAHLAGWIILVNEMVLLFTWHLPTLSTFSSRPLSVFNFWLDFQWAGMKVLPVQILMACPLLCVIAFVATDYFYTCAASIFMAVLSCGALRTAVVAGIVYFSAVQNFRSWIAGCLMLGIVPFMIGMLMLFFTGTGFMPWQHSIPRMVVYQVTLQFAAVAAAVAAGSLWHLVSRPRKLLFHWW